MTDFAIQRVLDAIEIIQRHLDEDWIAEGCNDERSFGCASCHAVMLRTELQMLADAITENQAL
jgi:hypothetical protein